MSYVTFSTLQQEYCDGHILLDASNRPSNTPGKKRRISSHFYKVHIQNIVVLIILVRVGKIPNAGKRLFPSSIRRIDHMTRELENSTEDFSRQNFGNCDKPPAKVSNVGYIVSEPCFQRLNKLKKISF